MTIDECRTLLASMISDPDSASSIADNIISELQSDEEKRNKETEDKKTETGALNAKVADLTKQVNSYKAREFLGTLGNQKSEPYDPIKEAVKIASKIINPNGEGEDKN